jgi:hypothetical protein
MDALTWESSDAVLSSNLLGLAISVSLDNQDLVLGMAEHVC